MGERRTTTLHRAAKGTERRHMLSTNMYMYIHIHIHTAALGLKTATATAQLWT